MVKITPVQSPQNVEDELSSSIDLNKSWTNYSHNHSYDGFNRINITDLNFKCFINYPPSSINNCGICISVFISYTLPMFSSFVYNYEGERSRNNWNRLLFDFKIIPSLISKIDQWIFLAKDCVAFACGSRMLSFFDLSTHFILELEKILNYIFSHYTSLSVHIDNLFNMWIIMILFFLAIEDTNRLSESIISLYRLSTTHSEHILPITKHKIYSLMILLPENESFSWLEQINSLGTEATRDVLNLLLLSTIINHRALNWKGSWDEVSFEQSEVSRNFQSQMLQCIDQINEHVQEYPLQDNYPPEISNFFESVICTNKATIFTLNNNHQDALTWASKSFTICKKLTFPFNCIINSIATLTSIFKALSKNDLEHESKNLFKINHKKYDTTIEDTVELPQPMHLYKPNGVMFSFMKIEHCIHNDNGLDISDITIFE